MPMAFRDKFRSCVVVIDCFEVFIERPSNLKARAQTCPITKNITLLNSLLVSHHKAPSLIYHRDGVVKSLMYISQKIAVY